MKNARKHIWVPTPALYVLFGVILVLIYFQCRLFSLKSWGILLVEVFCLLIAVGATFFGEAHFRKYLKRNLNSACRVISGARLDALRQFSVPLAVIGEQEEIIFANEAFAKNVAHAEFVSGEDIRDFLSGHPVSEISESGLDVEYGGQCYTVFLNRINDEKEPHQILYFIENTYYKETVAQYERTRPAAAIIVFDNLEEISKTLRSSEVTHICAEVEEKIEEWISAKGGLVNKVSTGRYVVFWEKQVLNAAIESKFDLLDEVRSLQIDDQMNATLSIGVGCAGDSFRECYEMAGQSLDMALGRGGDQAVLRIDGSYRFFGGVSKSVEKRSRVRARVIANALGTLIRESDNVLIMGHRNSDMDCIGAAVGVWAIAHKMYRKPARVILDRTTTVAKSAVAALANESHTDLFTSPEQAVQMMTDNTVLVIVDTHSSVMLDMPELYQRAKKVAVIDHHRKMVNYIDNAVIFYHEPYASSASEMVAELVEYIAENSIDALEAGVILSGIMLDTKNFVLKTGVRTFEAAAFLRRKGADTVEVKRLFADSAEQLLDKYRLVENAEMIHGMAISVGEDNGKDQRVTAAQAADELLCVRDVDASFVLFPFGNGINVSARSFGRVNVQLIMEKIGGGGHLTMAGAQLADCTPEEAKKRVVAAINDYISEYGALLHKS